jgi:hypothetical protein
MEVHAYIYTTVSQAVPQEVAERVYPICAPGGTDLPFITYHVTEQRADGTKDTRESDVTVEVAVVGKNLMAAHELADVITAALEADEDEASQNGLDFPTWQNTAELYDINVDGYVVTTAVKYKRLR